MPLKPTAELSATIFVNTTASRKSPNTPGLSDQHLRRQKPSYRPNPAHHLQRIPASPAGHRKHQGLCGRQLSGSGHQHRVRHCWFPPSATPRSLMSSRSAPTARSALALKDSFFNAQHLLKAGSTRSSMAPAGDCPRSRHQLVDGLRDFLWSRCPR